MHCRLRINGSVQRISVVLPKRMRRQEAANQNSCLWSSNRFEESVTLQSPDETLKEVKRRDIDPRVGVDGDDMVYPGVHYYRHTPVFGSTYGERLSYGEYDDGTPTDTVDLQAHHVRFGWSFKRGTYDSVRAELNQARNSIAVG